MKPKNISFHHPGMVVPNLEAAIQFYTEFLGCELYSRSEWDEVNDGFNQAVGLTGSAAKLGMLKGENFFLELFEYLNEGVEISNRKSVEFDVQKPSHYASETGLRHMAFCVEDVAVALERCASLGGQRINDPVSFDGGATVSYCRDPFGNLLELVCPGGRFPLPFGE